MRSICATFVFVFLATPGCALSHLRADPADVPDAAVSDAARPDSGPIESCTAFWSTMPWCPAAPAEVLGQRCADEGTRCGFGCCEPSPAVVCRGGVWTLSDEPHVDCSGVRCAAPTPCGTGSCAFGRVCLQPSTEIRLPDRCVVPPAPIASCGDAPAGSIGAHPGSCSHCECDDASGHVEVVLSCDCCDSVAP
jgi:hypothetical protein